MVGSFAVGKTSLVRRFVLSLFDDKYLTTVGVKIDKRLVEVGNRTVNMILWDLAGEDAFGEVRMDYVRGASGVILVVDGTRPDTLEVAASLRGRIEASFGRIPTVLALNKWDLTDQWRLAPTDVEGLASGGLDVFRTSAATGEGVEDLFERLAQRMVSS